MTSRALLLLLAIAGSLPAAAASDKAATHPVTFTADIALIVFNNCAGCHHPGEAAPFNLTSYDDVKKRGALIAAVTSSHYMPPWHAAPGFGDFAGERRLTDQQIALIGQWVKAGTPLGDPAKLPALPHFTEGWHLGKPDLIVSMPKSFSLPASGPDIYRNFVIPLNLTEDRWVRAVEFHPGTRSVVHHCLFSYDPSGTLRRRDGSDGQPGFGGMGSANTRQGGSLGGWAVGATPVPLADGLAFPLPKGSDLVLQEHFHLTGRAETEQSTVGIYFAAKAPARRLMSIQVPAVFGIGTHLKIPAGDPAYTIRDSFELPVDVNVWAAGAHAHYLAKNMKLLATRPDGSKVPLLWIPDWDFAWQDRYPYKHPFVLPKGTRIDVEITYDNSASNPRNPSNPPKEVWWGEGSFDEMGSMSIQVTAVNQEDQPALNAALRRASGAALMNAVADGTVKRLKLGPHSAGVARQSPIAPQNLLYELEPVNF